MRGPLRAARPVGALGEAEQAEREAPAPAGRARAAVGPPAGPAAPAGVAAPAADRPDASTGVLATPRVRRASKRDAAPARTSVRTALGRPMGAPAARRPSVPTGCRRPGKPATSATSLRKDATSGAAARPVATRRAASTTVGRFSRSPARTRRVAETTRSVPPARRCACRRSAKPPHPVISAGGIPSAPTGASARVRSSVRATPIARPPIARECAFRSSWAVARRMRTAPTRAGGPESVSPAFANSPFPTGAAGAIANAASGRAGARRFAPVAPRACCRTVQAPAPTRTAERYGAATIRSTSPDP